MCVVMDIPHVQTSNQFYHFPQYLYYNGIWYIIYYEHSYNKFSCTTTILVTNYIILYPFVNSRQDYINLSPAIFNLTFGTLVSQTIKQSNAKAFDSNLLVHCSDRERRRIEKYHKWRNRESVKSRKREIEK